MGPLPTSITGHRYVASFTDLESKYRWTYLLKYKSEAVHALRKLHAELKSHNISLSTLKSDNGGEFVNSEFELFCQDNGIVHHRTPPHTPNANSPAERYNRTLMERVRAMLSCANLPKALWSEALQTTTYIYNRLPIRTLEMTPYEALFKTKPDVSRLRAYGCVSYAYNFDINRDKLDSRAFKGVLVGYDTDSAAYRIYLPKQQKLLRSGHVRFQEHSLYYDREQEQENLNESRVLHPPIDIANNNVAQNTVNNVTQDIVMELATEVSHSDINYTQSTVVETVDINDSSPSRPIRTKKSPQHLNDYITFLADSNHLTVEQLEYLDIDSIDTFLADDAPVSYTDIAHWPDSEEWYQATNAENESIAEHNVFQVVDNLPEGRTALKAKYIYKVKYDANKKLKRKARLVIKGYSQIKGVDFNKVFAPVVNKSSLRILLSIAAVKDLDIHQLDIKTAFLNGTLEEEIYMLAIPGMPYPEGTILKLLKALYGLKQAPRVFNIELNNFVIKHGFQKMCYRPRCLFYGSGWTRYLPSCLCR